MVFRLGGLTSIITTLFRPFIVLGSPLWEVFTGKAVISGGMSSHTVMDLNLKPIHRR